MTYKDNQPTFNINRKVVNFKDFNKETEEIELKKIKRQNKPNSERQQLIGNPRIKYNKVTHKLDFDNNPDLLKDKIESLEESVVNSEVLSSIKDSISYGKFVETLKIAIMELESDMKNDSIDFDNFDIDTIISEALKEARQ
jgi:hypothetical protein